MLDESKKRESISKGEIDRLRAANKELDLKYTELLHREVLEAIEVLEKAEYQMQDITRVEMEKAIRAHKHARIILITSIAIALCNIAIMLKNVFA